MSERDPGRDDAPVWTRGRIPQPRTVQISPAALIESFAHRMMYSVAKDEYTATDYDVYQALAFAVRDRLMERWFETQRTYYRSSAKRVYYLSLEFLMGRALLNNVLNLGAYDAASRAMDSIGYTLEDLEELEADAGLGNGGLGRLAACMLDSAATLSLPVYGYGIRYEYGIFWQQIENGFQIEQPDNWLRYGNPWEIPRHDAIFPVKFYGRSQSYVDDKGVTRYDWVETEDVWAMAYDMPIIGYGNDTVNSLRLWTAKSSREFDLTQFNAGNYVRAVEQKNQTENISKVLYPPDDQYAGKELRLKQQYFFVSATLQDVIRRFKKKEEPWPAFPDHVAIQLNDTHPAVAIPELMRIFIDGERLEWEEAWEITRQVFGYTNHTVLPEALESWSTELFGRLLPRHLQIVEEVDRRFHEEVRQRFPTDEEKVRRTAIVEGGVVRMANLAIVGSRSVNGVARLHTEIVKNEIFPDFYALYPERFGNKTNGITPRRWLLKCNRPLAALITDAIGDAWITDLDQLRNLTAFADDASFQERWAAAKRQNKVELARWTKAIFDIDIDPSSMIDCHVKRIHEYKRQLLNVLRVIGHYLRIKDGTASDVPRTVLFSGKAAPSYFMAKLIIKLIHAVADLVSRDPEVGDRLRVVFIPNYGVTAAEKIFPACELSEQISTAGTEASGTGNMKAALNGALTVGTLDGANIEIREEVGPENIFIFGHTAEEIAALRRSGTYSPAECISRDPELSRVMDILFSGPLHAAEPVLFQPLIEALKGADRYFHCADYRSYVECQNRIDDEYHNQAGWSRKSILNVAAMGKFSCDRTVAEYARDIWRAEAVPIDIDQMQLSYTGIERRR
jgi:glycogen phosphorylase